VPAHEAGLQVTHSPRTARTESRGADRSNGAAPTTGPSSRAIALTPPAQAEPVAAFTVDVEDWYQSCVDLDAPITDRVVRNVHTILALLDESGIKGTFFVQGLVAETFPHVVATLVAEGHEVQSHGYSHRPLFAMSTHQLRDELERARTTVEDAAGTAVTAFRAQDFSILRDNLWALDVLAEAGFEIDSSIFPMRSKKYGIAGWELAPHVLTTPSGRRIVEVPVAVWETRRLRLPVAGGGYFRLLPKSLLTRAVRSIATSGRPPVIYCHPYEFSSGELGDYRGRVPRRLLVSQGIGRAAFPARIRALLEAVRFGRFDAVLRGWGVTG
jgi:polysaccharide deacetylase family protein (PEP-CTERM system associated)